MRISKMEVVWRVCRRCDGKGFTKPNGLALSRIWVGPTITCTDCGGKGLEVNKNLDSTRKEG